MSIDNKEYKYYAFISYNSQDTAWGDSRGAILE